MAKRIGSVDILKALGICSVILYHTEALPTVVNGWIGSYFMPLFFFASGLTFSAKQRKFGAFLKKKCVYLLLPYLLYLVCCAAVGVAKQVIRGVAFPVKSFLLGAVSGLPNMNEYTGRAWFIYCFFCGGDTVLLLAEMDKRQAHAAVSGCADFSACRIYLCALFP